MNKIKQPEVSKDLALEKIKPDLDPKMLINLRSELRMTDTPDKIELDLMPLQRIFLNAMRLEKRSAFNIYNIFVSFYDQAPVLQNIFNLVYKLLKEKKTEIFENLAAVVHIIVAAFKR